MNLNVLSYFVAITLFGLILAQGSDNFQTRNTNNDIRQYISQGAEKFGLRLFKIINDHLGDVGYDFMISPFTVYSLLALLNEGANGNTKKQLENSLGIPSDIKRFREGFSQIQDNLRVNTPTVKVSYSQSMFTNSKSSVKPEYENLLRNVYRSYVKQVNFQQAAKAQKYINDFIRDSTDGLIDYVVNEQDLTDAQLVLISTIFFKGQWKSPFNNSLTHEEPFYDDKGKALGNVKMMFQRANFPYLALQAVDSYVLEIPYGKDDRLSMIVLLPKPGGNLGDVIEKVSIYGVQNLMTELKRIGEQNEEDEVELYLPRFKTESDFVLNIVLEQMGIQDLFDASKADLSNISDQSLYLSRIFHKSVIEVNEEGTVASAITGGILANKASPTRYIANRPFAYLIVDKLTKSLLFCGQVRDPTKSSK